uniref:Tc1-like transposase DDE domain-containing protein n=1 Tax=Scylla olivacea TaxID=85551 RepID=A0A0P4VQV0_SCYOL
MGLKSNLSEETILGICKLRETGFTNKEIAQLTGVSRRSVDRWLKAAREAPSGIIPLQKKPPGKHMKVSKDTLVAIKRQIDAEPRLSARELRDANPHLLGSVSERTVNRYIKCVRMNLPIQVVEKPLLTDRYTQLRLAFASKYKHLPLEDVRTILWSDEATFSVTGITNCRSVEPCKGDPRAWKTVKQLGTVTVWGAFSYYGTGKLVFLEDGDSMNGPRYLEMLCDHLADCFDQCKAKRFQHDCAPYHTNRRVLEWLEDCGIYYFRDWPPNSPDINLIEDLWVIMKKELSKRDTHTLPKLKKSLITVWESLHSDLLRRLVDSFPERLREVRRRQGATIIRQIMNIDGSTPSCSASRTPAGPLSIANVSSESSSPIQSPGFSSTGLSEDELLLDEDMDLKLEIKEEVVDDSLREFVNVLDHVEKPPDPKEDDVEVLAVSKPSTSASFSNIEFVDMIPHQMEIPPDPKEDPVDVLAVTKPSSVPSTSSVLLKKAGPAPPRIEDVDEFHLFGMFVASQLRALPLRDALQAQLEIQTLLAQKRSQRLT